MAVNVLGSNSNIYDAAKAGVQVKQLNVDKYAERKKYEAEEERKKNEIIGNLSNTGLNRTLNELVTAEHQSFIDDVTSGKLEYQSQEYYKRYNAYKQSISQADKLEKEGAAINKFVADGKGKVNQMRDNGAGGIMLSDGSHLQGDLASLFGSGGYKSIEDVYEAFTKISDSVTTKAAMSRDDAIAWANQHFLAGAKDIINQSRISGGNIGINDVSELTGTERSTFIQSLVMSSVREDNEGESNKLYDTWLAAGGSKAGSFPSWAEKFWEEIIPKSTNTLSVRANNNINNNNNNNPPLEETIFDTEVVPFTIENTGDAKELGILVDSQFGDIISTVVAVDDETGEENRAKTVEARNTLRKAYIEHYGDADVTRIPLVQAKHVITINGGEASLHGLGYNPRTNSYIVETHKAGNLSKRQNVDDETTKTISTKGYSASVNRQSEAKMVNIVRQIKGRDGKPISEANVTKIMQSLNPKYKAAGSMSGY